MTLMLFLVLLSVVTTLMNYMTHFWLFLRRYLILERQISGCDWENMNHLLVPKSEKSWGKPGGQSTFDNNN